MNTNKPNSTKSVELFADQITTFWKKSSECFIRVGCLIIESDETLNKDQKKELRQKIGLSEGTLSKLRTVGSLEISLFFKIETLPASLSTLYEIAKFVSDNPERSDEVIGFVTFGTTVKSFKEHFQSEINKENEPDVNDDGGLDETEHPDVSNPDVDEKPEQPDVSDPEVDGETEHPEVNDDVGFDETESEISDREVDDNEPEVIEPDDLKDSDFKVKGDRRSKNKKDRFKLLIPLDSLDEEQRNQLKQDLSDLLEKYEITFEDVVKKG